MASARLTRNGKWEIRWDEPTSAGGRRQRSRTVEASSKDDALLIAGRLEATKPRSRDEGRTFTDAARLWLELRPRARSAREVTETRLSLHVLPALGHMRLDRITQTELARFIAELSERRSANFVHNCWTDISGALKLARAHGWIAEVPERPLMPRRSRRLMELPTPGRVRFAVDQLDDCARPTWAHTELRLAVRLAVGTAARQGEIGGLRWGDITPHGIRVQRALSAHRGGIEVVDTKGRVRRTVPTPTWLSSALDEHRQAVERLVGRPPEPEHWIFLCTQGRPLLDPMNPGLLGNRWSFWRSTHGVWWRFHDFRHWTISRWLEAGVSPEQVAQWAGHRRTTTTIDTYGHLISRRDDRGVAALEELWSNS